LSSSTSTGASEKLEPEIAAEASAPGEAADPAASIAGPVEAGAAEAASTAKTGRFQSFVDLLHDLAIAVVVCVLLITYVVQAFKVQGTSMSPELKDGERILVNKFLYYIGDNDRGDVVVFWYPEDPELSFIKRVVALPGETVEIRSGAVFVNGAPIDEPYVAGANADLRSFPPQDVRPGHYFVLGDNRKGSNDSRSWGLVPERYVYGKAFLRIWPPSDLGVVD
jgi:signal peptidase I